MSDREQLQYELAAWLESWQTAPYGVVASMYTPDNKRGKARTLTFGLAGTLDATLYIWSVTCLHLKSSRSPEDMTFASVDAFKDYCHRTFGASLAVEAVTV